MGEFRSREAGVLCDSERRTVEKLRTVQRSSQVLVQRLPPSFSCGLDFIGTREWSCGRKPGRRPRIQLHRPVGFPETDQEKHTGLYPFSAELRCRLRGKRCPKCTGLKTATLPGFALSPDMMAATASRSGPWASSLWGLCVRGRTHTHTHPLLPIPVT